MSFDVGERIREFRKQAGLNQDQLAELSSLNRVTVANQGFLLAFFAVPIVPYRAFCAVCGMQNGMQ